MIRNITANDKKRALLAHREKILQEIKYYEKRIDEFSNESSGVYFGADSSDSEDGFPTFLDIGPSISELKRQDRLLKTCLQATQELTSVTVLESEVQVLVKDPDIGSEKPVREPGLWREVTAECRLDLVPFTILFYVHQPSRRFAAASYRGLRVQAVKASQEAELSASVLHTLTSPADVLETLRSYAGAYRSRRGSLARLADCHAGSLYMQPREEGGFLLKCGSVMQMSWRLENKTSPLAPFQHKMNFELEYMDESFLKIIRQAHRQLSNPSLQTDERTQLLSKIISTCIEAQGQDNVESDTDSKKLEKTTLDDDSDVNIDERDKEVMAPPKSIPKRSKPKGKENDDGNRKSIKRSADEVDGNTKRVKSDVNDSSSKNNKDVSDIEKTRKVADVSDEKSSVNVKNKDTRIQVTKKVTKTSKTGQEKSVESETVRNKNENQQNKAKTTKNSEVNNADKENNDNITNETEERQTGKVTQNNSKNSKATDSDVNKNPKKKTQSDKNSESVHANKIANDSNNKKSVNSNDKDKKTVNSSAKSKNGDSGIANIKKVANSDSTKNSDTANIKKNITDTKNVKTDSNVKKSVNADSANVNKTVSTNSVKTKKVLENANTNSSNANKIALSETEKIKKSINSEANGAKILNSDIMNANKVVSSDSVKTKKINTDSENTKKRGNTDSIAKKIVNPVTKNIEVSNSKIVNADKKNSAKTDVTTKTITNVKNPKNLSKDVKISKMVIKNHRNSGGKANRSVSLKPSISKESKIPQKKLSPAYAAVLKQNPVRISPRMISKFKSPSDSNIQSKLFKPVTNIPRLLKKPAPKSK